MSNRHDLLEADPATAPTGALDARRHALERRLEDGYGRIDQATLAGQDVGEWEDFWVGLLREYEDVCRELEIAA